MRQKWLALLLLGGVAHGAEGVASVCAGEAPTDAAGLALWRYATDPSVPRIHRLLHVRNAAERAGIKACAWLIKEAAFEAPPRRVLFVKAAPIRGRVDWGATAPQKPKTRLEVGEVSVSGRCVQRDIERVMGARQRGLLYCYEKALSADQKLAGVLVLRVAIDGTGKVTDASATPVGERLEDVSGCMQRSLSRWSFPRPSDGTCDISFPVTLSVEARR